MGIGGQTLITNEYCMSNKMLIFMPKTQIWALNRCPLGT